MTLVSQLDLKPVSHPVCSLSHQNYQLGRSQAVAAVVAAVFAVVAVDEAEAVVGFVYLVSVCFVDLFLVMIATVGQRTALNSLCLGEEEEESSVGQFELESEFALCLMTSVASSPCHVTFVHCWTSSRRLHCLDVLPKICYRQHVQKHQQVHPYPFQLNKYI